jgi:hypothetical protein
MLRRRIYDYVLGGKDNYALDREAAEASLRAFPAMRTGMRANRAFMHRVGRFLAAERGIRQFLDVGTGIPTQPNLHEVVQVVTPEARTVYVDNDPIVLAHARALMTSTPQGRTSYINADMRDPETILGAPKLRETVDLVEPIGLMLIAILHFIEDDDEVHGVTRRLVDVLPSGSYFAASIGTADIAPESLAKVREQYHAHGAWCRYTSGDPIRSTSGGSPTPTSRCTGRSGASRERRVPGHEPACVVSGVRPSPPIYAPDFRSGTLVDSITRSDRGRMAWFLLSAAVSGSSLAWRTRPVTYRRGPSCGKSIRRERDRRARTRCARPARPRAGG